MDMKRVETIEDAMNWAKENSISPKVNVDSGDIYFLIQTIKQQHTLIERYKEALEFYAERNHYRVLEFYDHNEILDHGEIARQALEGGGG